jgi:hypothetical protein
MGWEGGMWNVECSVQCAMWKVESRAKLHPSQKVFITGLVFVFCANDG